MATVHRKVCPRDDADQPARPDRARRGEAGTADPRRRPRGGAGGAREDLPDYHASPGEAADAAREAGAGALVLTHIVPPLPLKALEGPFLGDAAERFTGPLWMARDGDLYSLPLGTREVERSGLIPRGG